MYSDFYYLFMNRKDDNSMNISDIKVNIKDKVYKARSATLDSKLSCYPHLKIDMELNPDYLVSNKVGTSHLYITNVIFNPPATVIFWSDDTKTVVKCDCSKEDYDPEKGIAMAVSKKMLGDNKGEYYNIFKNWLKKWNKQN